MGLTLYFFVSASLSLYHCLCFSFFISLFFCLWFCFFLPVSICPSLSLVLLSFCFPISWYELISFWCSFILLFTPGTFYPTFPFTLFLASLLIIYVSACLRLKPTPPHSLFICLCLSFSLPIFLLSLCFYLCLFIASYLFFSASFFLSIPSSVFLPLLLCFCICVFFLLSLSYPQFFFFSLSFSLSQCVLLCSIYLSLLLSVYICLSVFLSTYLFVPLFSFLSIYRPMSLFLCVFLSDY